MYRLKYMTKTENQGLHFFEDFKNGVVERFSRRPVYGLFVSKQLNQAFSGV